MFALLDSPMLWFDILTFHFGDEKNVFWKSGCFVYSNFVFLSKFEQVRLFWLIRSVLVFCFLKFNVFCSFEVTCLLTWCLRTDTQRSCYNSITSSSSALSINTSASRRVTNLVRGEEAMDNPRDVICDCISQHREGYGQVLRSMTNLLPSSAAILNFLQCAVFRL